MNSTKEIRWFYPKTIQEATGILSTEKAKIHAGGTALLLSHLKNVKTLIDIQKLPLDTFSSSDGMIEIGASQTFSSIIYNISKFDPDSILIKSLTCAANTPLRNRITLGGSIAFAPLWSDLIGPLLVIESEVFIEGPDRGVYQIDEVIKNRNILKNNLITKIRFPYENRDTFYYRETRTEVDFSSFTISMNAKKNPDNSLSDIKIAITGTKNKFERLPVLENKLSSETITSENIDVLLKYVNFEFLKKSTGSTEYTKETAKTYLKRGIESIIGL